MNNKEDSLIDLANVQEEFEVDDALREDFLSYARLEEARIDISGYTEELRLALKANIAQQLFGPNAYEYFLNEGDPMIEKIFDLEANETPE